MKIIKVRNYDELSMRAAEMIINRVKDKPNIKLGLATGGTPEGMYRKIIENHKSAGTSYRDVVTFNLDEYVGLSGNDPNSYRHYMNEKLFQHIDVHKRMTHIPHGDAADIHEECQRYEGLIKENGGVDLQILGIGKNGHIGFNEPGSSFDSKTHIVELTASTRQANARYFSDISKVPTRAITMGIGTIMKSREILLIASGDRKAEAVARLVKGEVSCDFPASTLNKHPFVTLIADEEALSKVDGSLLQE